MAKRNLARTTRKHGRFVEYLMMRYLEQKVCDFTVMVLHTNSKNMEILIPKAKEIPKKCQSLLHIMSDSGFYVVWDDVTSKWFTRGNKLVNYQQLIHPLGSSPE
jgi:regulator of sigma D